MEESEWVAYFYYTQPVQSSPDAFEMNGHARY